MNKLYETDKDLINQRMVMDVINNWMNRLPIVGGGFRYDEIKTKPGRSEPDFKLLWGDKCIGVVEIKCHMMRVKTRHDQLMISRGKLEMLYKQNTPAMLAYGVFVNNSLAEVLFADLRSLIDNRNRWNDAEQDHSNTTNHGKGKRASPDKCYLLPVDVYVSVKL